MSCTNCFNGCAEIVSDKCVKYTGIDIPGLNIHTGDTLLTVENAITSKILTLMDGTGIIPKIAPADVCDVVKQFLPCCPPFDLNVVLTAYLKAICDINDRLELLKQRVIIVEDAILALNSPYDVGDCLTGVDDTSETHEVLQATIDALCTLVLEVHEKYVLKTDVNSYIAAYIAGIPAATNYSSRMVPRTAIPYFGPLTGNFDGTGAGIVGTVWEKIYICNGLNFTPDLRGVVLAGDNTITGAALDPRVTPGGTNPTYSVLSDSITGNNLGYLTSIDQVPLHTHAATFAGTPQTHSHTTNLKMGESDAPDTQYDLRAPTSPDGTAVTITSNPVTLTPAGTITVTATGLSTPVGHGNVQPTKATNYIMYIP